MPLKITAECYEEMMTYTHLSDEDEVTTFLFSEEREGDHVIYGLSLPEQVQANTSVDTVDSAGWHAALTKKQRMDWHGWHHTHPGMSLFWSPADNDTCESLLQGMENFLISLLTNEKEEIKARIDVKIPIEMTSKDVKLVICPRDKVMSRLKKHFDKQVSRKRDIMVDYARGYIGHLPSAAVPSRLTNIRENAEKGKLKRIVATEYDLSLGTPINQYEDGTWGYEREVIGAFDDGHLLGRDYIEGKKK